MELLLAGFALGIVFGWYFTKYKLDAKIDDMEDMIQDQYKLILLQKKYIDQEGLGHDHTKGKSINKV